LTTLSVAAEPSALVVVQAFISEAARQAGLGALATHRLALAVEELTANIVQHGYVEQGLTGDLQLSWELRDDRLVVMLQDHGIPFDPTRHHSPTAADLARPIEEREIGGLGIYLALRGLDGFRYERGPGVNRSILEMRRAPAG
jgi:anti-sigma regulatory factor (Ser/Thr protein kinase)